MIAHAMKIGIEAKTREKSRIHPVIRSDLTRCNQRSLLGEMAAGAHHQFSMAVRVNLFNQKIKVYIC